MNEAKRRVAITGLGLVTPVGNDVATAWNALLAGRSGVAPISLFDASGFPVRIASEVKGFDPLTAIVADNGIQRGLNALLTEGERVKKFGFLQSELDRTRT